MADVTKFLKDAAYVGVGMGVIGFQKAQVRRQELLKALDGQVDEAREGFAKLTGSVDERVKLLEERLGELESRIEVLVDQFEDRLPEQARELVKQAREAAKDAQGQLRAIVNRAA